MEVDELEIQSWQALDKGIWDNLLIGNGFSISISNKFNYSSLLEIVDARNIRMYPHARALFGEGKVATSNFEEVLRVIHHGWLVNFYNLQAIETLYSNVRRSLIEAVREAHVAFSEVPLAGVYQALKCYRKVFTTNYDLIPYWAMMDGKFEGFCDFFWGRDVTFDPFDVENWSGKTEIHYLHGALHLKTTASGSTEKMRGIRWQSIDDVIHAGGRWDAPLFISEGTAAKKIQKIKDNSYLAFCYKKLLSAQGGLVVYGHGLNKEYDAHVLQGIASSSLERVAIGIYSGLEPQFKKHEASRLALELARFGKELHFFESSTHPLSTMLSPAMV